MPETEPHEAPHYQEQVELGRVLLGEQHVPLYLQLHQSREPFSQHGLVPMTRTADPITYFHAKPYLIEPEITLDVALHPHPSPAGDIGRVVGSDTAGVRRREVGQAQAWYYPGDRTIVLWECYLLDQYREEDPFADFGLQEIWLGFERVLVARSAAAERIITTWEDIYPRPVWQRFLESRGYRQIDKAVFVRPANDRISPLAGHNPLNP